MKRTALSLLALALAAPLLLSVAPATSATPAPHPPGAPVRAQTAGRVEVDHGVAKYSWPGVYFEGRFRGTGVGIVLHDPANDYDVQIDGRTVTTLVLPADGTHWVRGLKRGEHTVRIVKRTESPWAVSGFGGFVAAPGGAVLAAPPARHRQIEFIGDSFTAGYGNVSTSRDCGDQLNRLSNADLSFGALTARKLNADYQLNAFSGRGMVRNYNGIEPGTNFRTYYDRALLSDPSDVWPVPPSWHPQLVVVGLGINDFSTALNPGEQWADQAALIADYKTAYNGFLDKLRRRYGPRTVIVASATYQWNGTMYPDSVQSVVAARNAAGDRNLRYWYYPETDLDFLGCDWHPSARDHEIIAQRLQDYLASLSLKW
jgi:lysophospholipase L1-like esterase